VQKRSGLGRGLGALIPSEVGEQDGVTLLEVPTGSIVANRHQPRDYFDEESLVSLTASVKELGVLQPVLVRRVAEDRFELIAGERRWRAARRAGLPTIPALLREVDDRHSLEQALVENLHRQDLNALEEAAAYSQLMEDFDLTQDEVAQRVGKSRSAVANTLRLFQLPPAVQRLVAEGRLGAGHARALLGTPDRAEQERLADQAVAESWSVREVETRVRGLIEASQPTAVDDDGFDEDDAVSASGTETRSPPIREAAVLELEELLSARLDTRVSVTLGTKRGRVVVEFADLDDLERIYRIISPPGATAGE
jgi:ParB family transcriptional regulator, chromosome partitioning protein